MARPRKLKRQFAEARRSQNRLVDWMRVNHDDLQYELGAGRIDWRAAMVVIRDLQLTDEHGQPPSRDTTARTWARVRREVVDREALRNTVAKPALQPGELAPGVRLVTAVATATDVVTQARPTLDIRPARPRQESKSAATLNTPIFGTSATPAQAPLLSGSPPAQPGDGATEHIQSALRQLAASRVPMPKRVP